MYYMINYSIHSAILKTLCYADIFDYPLTLFQIRKFLMGARIKKKDIKTVLEELDNLIVQQDGYYFLSGRKQIVSERKRRMKLSLEKLNKHRPILKLLSLIPTIRLLGISGSLAVNNAREKDDIDIFIITRKNTLWITRFLILVLLLLLGRKRGRDEKVAQDKICPNMFMREDAIEFRGEDRNLFIAHEMVQLKIVSNKDRTYEKFLLANSWISYFLPNAVDFERVRREVEKELRKQKSAIFRPFFNFILEFFDKILFITQFAYMESQITNERIRRDRVFFHPVDKKDVVLKDYAARCEYFTYKLDNQPIEIQSPKDFELLLITPGY